MCLVDKTRYLGKNVNKVERMKNKDRRKGRKKEMKKQKTKTKQANQIKEKT